MLKPGSAKKVTVYVGEDVHHRGEPVYLSVLNYLFSKRVSGATVMKGVAGFGSDHHLHTARILEVSENLPIKIEFVEEPEKVDQLLPKLLEIVGQGLVEIQDTTIVRTATAKEPDRLTPHVALRGRAKLMRIFVGEDDRWDNRPLHEAIVEEARRQDLVRATVYRGIKGYRASNRPLMVCIIDEELKIQQFLPTLERMVDEGLIAISDVELIRLSRRDAKTADERGL